MRNLVLQEPEVRVTNDATSSLSYAWQCIRVPVIAPLLWFAIFVCAAMSIMLFIERVYMAIIIICVKVMRKKRYTKYKLDAMKEDLELNKTYPKVLIQIPMYNEKEVCLTFPEHLSLLVVHRLYTKLVGLYIENTNYHNLPSKNSICI